MTVPRVLIVEDHQVVAEGLVRLFAGRADVVGVIGDGSLALPAAARLEPDVIVLDISLPHVSGLEVIRQVRAAGLDARTIVLTMHADAALAVEVLAAGAAGFVLKESSGDELLTALEVVLSGGTYLAAALTREILTLMVSRGNPAVTGLTAQQRAVLRLIVDGRRAKEIADALDISTRSVEAIKYKTMQQLDLHSTAALVRYAIEHRLVER